jgi:Holliday junction resolvasome RuvABC endonuclease subunit
MSKKLINVVGLDPSQSNFGIVEATIDVDTLEVDIVDMRVISTSSESAKGVIKVSDNLRRAKEIQVEMRKACVGKSMAIAEIPLMITTMNPKIASLANYNSGMMVGILSAIQIPLIQVFPKDVKLAMTGLKDACKEEMIEAAMLKHPAAPWVMRKLRGNMVPTAVNEHLADAIGALYAGIKTEQFGSAVGMYRALSA